MKLSLSWIFDHIAFPWQELDVSELVKKCNTTTAEIDDIRRVQWDFDQYAVAYVVAADEKQVVVTIPEWNKEQGMPARKDAIVGAWFLVKREGKQYRFATVRDFFCEKDGLIPAVSMSTAEEKGGWKKMCESYDYLITIDNKSITHRADLWGHRGMAREMAALLGVELIAEERFLAQKMVKSYDVKSVANAENPVTLEIAEPAFCSRIAGIYLARVERKASSIPMALRLMRIDARPIDALVDATNYVMYEFGQPMHAFDARAFAGTKHLVVGTLPGVSLSLLDGETIELTADDCVISDGKRPLSLAGVMGGAESGVRQDTSAVLLEAAHFTGSVIRKTALRYKKRTEASMRFEKKLDPNGNTTALLRYLALLDAQGISYTAARDIISLGAPREEQVLRVSQDFLSKKIGVTIPQKRVRTILTTLGFGVEERHVASGVEYHITVPTYRVSDVTIPEDIVEEVARFVGYDTIAAHVPSLALHAHDLHDVMRVRELKQYCAYALGMHEICSYALYDEEFLRTMDWEPQDALKLQNPVSEHWQRLVTSLMPHLLKAVQLASVRGEPAAFFEWSALWRMKDHSVQEKRALATVWYGPETLDFYAHKEKLERLFARIGLSVAWQRPRGPLAAWYHPHRTAELVYKDNVIGYAGEISPRMMHRVAPGHAFCGEFDADFLRAYTRKTPQFSPLPKYQSVDLDLSMLVPETITVAQLEAVIRGADARVVAVHLIDYFEKPEWGMQRSITMRYTARDDTKTMTKEEIDAVVQAVAHAVKCHGVMVR